MTSTPSNAPGSGAKKPYRRPRLTVYGDLRDITQASAVNGNVMDMVVNMNKSQ